MYPFFVYTLVAFCCYRQLQPTADWPAQDAELQSPREAHIISIILAAFWPLAIVAVLAREGLRLFRKI